MADHGLDTVSAVIPAHDEEGRVGRVVGEVRPFVDEVVVVDDGSSDGTAAEARRAGAVVVERAVNGGYLDAVRDGFRHATGGIVVTLDADGEHPPAAIPELVRPVRAGTADMAQGARRRAPRWSESALTALARLGGPVGDSGTGFRALRTDLARSLELDGRCICGTLSLEVLARGATIVDVPVELRAVDHSRRRAWYHVVQLRYVVRWIRRARRNAPRSPGPATAP